MVSRADLTACAPDGDRRGCLNVDLDKVRHCLLHERLPHQLAAQLPHLDDPTSIEAEHARPIHHRWLRSAARRGKWLLPLFPNDHHTETRSPELTMSSTRKWPRG